MSKRILGGYERHTKACRHDCWVVTPRLLLLRSETVLLLLLIALLFLFCDRNEQVMLRMVTEYMEWWAKAKSNSQQLYSIKREVASYQLAQHSSQHSRAAAAAPGCSE